MLLHGRMRIFMLLVLQKQGVPAVKKFGLLYLPDATHNGGVTPDVTRRRDYFVRHPAGREPPKEFRIH
jgi:hypothetical protein